MDDTEAIQRQQTENGKSWNVIISKGICDTSFELLGNDTHSTVQLKGSDRFYLPRLIDDLNERL